MLTCATAAVEVRAEPARRAPQAGRRVVAVEIHGTGSEVTLLSATILEVLARLGLTMVVEPRSTGGERVASVEIDLRASEVRITAFSAAGETVLDRTLRDPSPEIQREQIASAVRGAAEAQLLAEEDRDHDHDGPPPPVVAVLPALSRENAPVAEADAPSVSATTRDASIGRSLAVDVSTFFGGGTVASTAGVVMRAGASATLAYRRGPRPWLSVGGLYAFPFDTDQRSTTTNARLASARAIVGVQPLRTSWLALDIGAGGGLDFVSFDATSTTATPPSLKRQLSVVDPVLTGVVTARVPLASNVVFTLSGMLDVSLTERSSSPPPVGEETFSPRFLRPTILAGFSFTALGVSPFPRAARSGPPVERARASNGR